MKGYKWVWWQFNQLFLNFSSWLSNQGYGRYWITRYFSMSSSALWIVLTCLVLVACIAKLKIDISAHLSYHNSSYKNCLSNSRMPVTRNIKSSNSVLVEDISWDDYFKFNADLLCPAHCWLPPAHKSYLHSNQAIIYLKFTHFGNINNPSSLVCLDRAVNSFRVIHSICLLSTYICWKC